MKKSILFFPRLFILVLFTFLLVQCKKDEAPPKTASELIIGTWQLTGDNYSPAYDYFGNGTKITDAFSLYVACQKDDVTTFKTNSEGEFNEGATKCDVSDPQSTAFLWTLKENNTILNISALADFKIVSINSTTLKLSTTFDENGVTYTETFTFTKK